MAALTDSIRTDAGQLKSRHAPVAQQALSACVEMVMNKAEDLAENRQAYGEDAAQKLFNSLEGTLRTIMHADAKHKAHVAALGGVAAKIGNDASTADVRAAFADSVADAAAADDEVLERGYEPLKKLRKIVRDSDVAAGHGGAGPSGAGGSADDDDALGEDGFAMTQAARSTKCPLLQLEMTATGELRPVKAPCGHTFSFKGISGFAKGKKSVKCPQAGCNQSWSLAQLVDDKELIKELKKRARNLD